MSDELSLSELLGYKEVFIYKDLDELADALNDWQREDGYDRVTISKVRRNEYGKTFDVLRMVSSNPSWKLDYHAEVEFGNENRDRHNIESFVYMRRSYRDEDKDANRILVDHATAFNYTDEPLLETMTEAVKNTLWDHFLRLYFTPKMSPDGEKYYDDVIKEYLARTGEYYRHPDKASWSNRPDYCHASDINEKNAIVRQVLRPDVNQEDFIRGWTTNIPDYDKMREDDPSIPLL